MEASGKLENIFNGIKIKFTNAAKAAYREKFIKMLILAKNKGLK